MHGGGEGGAMPRGLNSDLRATLEMHQRPVRIHSEDGGQGRQGM